MTKFDTHMWIYLGMVPTLKKLTSPPQGGRSGNFRGSKNQSSGSWVKKSKLREIS